MTEHEIYRKRIKKRNSKHEMANYDKYILVGAIKRSFSKNEFSSLIIQKYEKNQLMFL